MKLKILLAAALILSLSANAQKKDQDKVELVYTEIDESQIMHFKDIENSPLAPGCKSKWKTEKKKKCTSKFIQDHVLRKFNTELAAKGGATGMVKILIEFVFDTTGKVINISASGGPDFMNKHAVEVMGRLPDFQPAIKDGEPVYVSGSFPLMFIAR